ncbi:hypothetical protein ACFPRL_28655 [Pseudoclavibacter helvolus]
MNTRPLPIPMAFMRPISRVRSCTDMSRVFTMPKLAASSAITANALSTSTIPSITGEAMLSSATPTTTACVSWVPRSASVLPIVTVWPTAASASANPSRSTYDVGSGSCSSPLASSGSEPARS